MKSKLFIDTELCTWLKEYSNPDHLKFIEERALRTLGYEYAVQKAKVTLNYKYYDRLENEYIISPVLLFSDRYVKKAELRRYSLE